MRDGVWQRVQEGAAVAVALLVVRMLQHAALLVRRVVVAAQQVEGLVHGHEVQSRRGCARHLCEVVAEAVAQLLGVQAKRVGQRGLPLQRGVLRGVASAQHVLAGLGGLGVAVGRLSRVDGRRRLAQEGRGDSGLGGRGTGGEQGQREQRQTKPGPPAALRQQRGHNAGHEALWEGSLCSQQTPATFANQVTLAFL